MGVLWLVTVRAKEGEDEVVEGIIRESVLPLLEASDYRSLAKCVNCAGEYTWVAELGTANEVEAIERSERYVATQGRLASHLRVPPRRELWEIRGRR